MAPAEGLEPPTYWFEARYSIQLSYAGVLSSKEASTQKTVDIHPHDFPVICTLYAYLRRVASPAGVEPTTSWTATKRSIH